jgi:hypothetical protein
MKKLLVASLVLSVSGLALAAKTVDRSDLAERQIRPAGANLASTLVRHEASVLDKDTGHQRVETKRHYASAAEAEYHALKLAGEEIPEALRLELFGPRGEGNGLRNGGDDAASAVNIPFSAGGVWTDEGTTLGFSDAVPAGQVAPASCNTSFHSVSFGGPDAWYSFTLPNSYTVSASVCDAADYDTCLGIFDSNMNLVAVNDDGAGCTGFTSLLPGCCLPAGTYYLVVDAYGDESGDYELTVEFGAEPCMQTDPCESAEQIACGGSFAGSTVGMENYVGNNAGDFFFEVTISEEGPITFSLCDGGTDYDSYLRLYDICPTDAGAVELAGNDDFCGLQSELTVVLDAGTYWLVVEGFSSSEGNFSLQVDCGTCDPIVCDGQAEVEPNEGPNGDPIVFDSIDCGITVCGSTWADGGNRDTDWYELLLLTPSYLTIDAEIEGFDALLFTIQSDAATIIDVIDDNGFCEAESFTTGCYPAGTYYIWIGHTGFEGVPEDQAYALSLSCEPCEFQDPCDNPLPLACNETIEGSSSDSQGGNVWETYCNDGETGPEVIYELNHSGGFLTIQMSSGTTEDLDMVLLGSCDPLDCLDMPYAVGPNETISGTYPAGTYYVVVDAWNWTGAAYTYTLQVTCGDDPCENLEPVDCLGMNEIEPNEGWNDDNASYNEISCNETVCGTVWADGGNRDLDWYRFEHEGGDILIETEIGEFDAILFLTDFALGGAIVSSANANPICVAEELFFPALPAGEYYVVIGHTAFEGVPNEQEYALTLTCLADPCEDHDPINCMGTEEVEPNEGWNGDPPNGTYGEIEDGETVCGTAWADGDTRDTDWYRFEVEETVNVIISAEIDWFDAILFLTDFDSDGGILSAVDNNGACMPESMTYECLEPGVYYAVIMHNAFEGVPDEEAYALSLNFSECVPVDPCADIYDAGTLDDVYTISRPAPIANHHNAINGCEGISSAGYDELHELTLVQGTTVRITHQGQGTADEVIYILSDCAFTETCMDGVDAGGSDTAPEILNTNLPAGTYFIVADFWGAAEAHPYTLTVDDLNVAVGENRQPLAFELGQNYPNPFNPVTTISWTQPELSRARLTIYNLLGAVVQVHDLGFRGAGVQQFSWDASGLSSGVYLYNLSTGLHSETRKAVLLK